AEDGIRDDLVTGVQTCALPICPHGRRRELRELTSVLIAARDRKASVDIRRDLCRLQRPQSMPSRNALTHLTQIFARQQIVQLWQIGRASCRERWEIA